MLQLSLPRWLDAVFLGAVVFLTHQTIFVCPWEGLNPPRTCGIGSPAQQVAMLFVVLFYFQLRTWSPQDRSGLVRGWGTNWHVGLFLALAVVSIFWSVFPPATFYRTVLLVLVALIASRAAFLVTPRDMVIFIAVTAGVFALASLLLAAVLPGAAIMSNRPYEGLWRGVFWHKIYLGATMALGYASCLVVIFSPFGEFGKWQKVAAAVVLVLGVVLAVLSDSASGLVVFAMQSLAFILVLLWLKWGSMISRRMYLFLGGGGVLAAVVVLFNLDFVFGFFNRTANMTGRIPMWLHVIEEYGAGRLLFGHGFGAFWLQPGINEKVQAVVGWGYPVRVADNGYIDVFLGLGTMGLLLMLIMLVTAFIRAFKVALLKRDLVHFFPLFLLIHIAFINISLSYFMEMEFFIWFLLTLNLFTQNRSYS